MPFDSLGPNDKRQNFSIAFAAAESVGIQTSLVSGEIIKNLAIAIINLLSLSLIEHQRHVSGGATGLAVRDGVCNSYL